MCVVNICEGVRKRIITNVLNIIKWYCVWNEMILLLFVWKWAMCIDYTNGEMCYVNSNVNGGMALAMWRK